MWKGYIFCNDCCCWAHNKRNFLVFVFSFFFLLLLRCHHFYVERMKCAENTMHKLTHNISSYTFLCLTRHSPLKHCVSPLKVASIFQFTTWMAFVLSFSWFKSFSLVYVWEMYKRTVECKTLESNLKSRILFLCFRGRNKRVHCRELRVTSSI